MGFYQWLGLTHYRFVLSDFKQVTDWRTGPKKYDFFDQGFLDTIDELVIRRRLTAADLKESELVIDDTGIIIRKGKTNHEMLI